MERIKVEAKKGDQERKALVGFKWFAKRATVAVSAVGEQMRDSVIGMLVCEREEKKTKEARERQDGGGGGGREGRGGAGRGGGAGVWGHGVGMRLVGAWVVVSRAHSTVICQQNAVMKRSGTRTPKCLEWSFGVIWGDVANSAMPGWD